MRAWDLGERGQPARVAPDGLFAAYELESEDGVLLQKLLSEWRSHYRRPNGARLIGKSDEEPIDEYYGTKDRC